MSDIFGGSGPDVRVIESPSDEITDEEIEAQKIKEREALGAFFSSLRTGGAQELRSPQKTGLNL